MCLQRNVDGTVSHKKQVVTPALSCHGYEVGDFTKCCNLDFGNIVKYV